MDLLTPSVNVPAERAKLRRLRDEIAADVEKRNEQNRMFSVRGFRRFTPEWSRELQLPEVRCASCGFSQAGQGASERADGCTGEIPRQGVVEIQAHRGLDTPLSAAEWQYLFRGDL